MVYGFSLTWQIDWMIYVVYPVFISCTYCPLESGFNVLIGIKIGSRFSEISFRFIYKHFLIVEKTSEKQIWRTLINNSATILKILLPMSSWAPCFLWATCAGLLTAKILLHLPSLLSTFSFNSVTDTTASRFQQTDLYLQLKRRICLFLRNLNRAAATGDLMPNITDLSTWIPVDS